MDKRVLGKSGNEVSPLGMGCMGITHASGDPMPDDEAASVVRQAHEMGYIFFDTAECYVGTCADGTEAHNEDVVGKALAPVRDEVVIATKFGVTHAPDKTILVDSRPEVIRISVEKSLRRLRTDHIDLYYQHRIDPKVEPEVVAGTMADLIKEGKIRAWGISEATEEYLRRADAVCPVSAVQNRYSMMARWNESLFPVLEELNVAFVAFSPASRAPRITAMACRSTQRKAKGALSPSCGSFASWLSCTRRRPPRSPFPGCSRRSPISFPSRAVASPNDCSRTSAPPRSGSPTMRLPRSTGCSTDSTSWSSAGTR